MFLYAVNVVVSYYYRFLFWNSLFWNRRTGSSRSGNGTYSCMSWSWLCRLPKVSAVSEKDLTTGGSSVTLQLSNRSSRSSRNVLKTRRNVSLHSRRCFVVVRSIKFDQCRMWRAGGNRFFFADVSEGWASSPPLPPHVTLHVILRVWLSPRGWVLSHCKER